MLNAGVLSFQEFRMREKLPLAAIQDAVLEFLRGRDDIDLVSCDAADLAEELRGYLGKRFHIAVRVRQVAQGRGYRLYQIRKAGNRHLVDLRPVAKLPPARRVEDVLVAEPPELIASKVIAYHQRRGQPKSGTDWRDLAMLLLRFPQLKRESGPVAERLQAAGADAAVSVWKEIVAQKIQPPDEDGEFQRQ
ncbi:MAG: nucleotidyl transferase AbiEii/AbiGii toxin family protein [Planctomycetes bacterium]|nr:nucleotidyl transferase AbiEii/AbiGii toxin family protein [Planctomycetota bacterium]